MINSREILRINFHMFHIPYLKLNLGINRILYSTNGSVIFNFLFLLPPRYFDMRYEWTREEIQLTSRTQ